VVIVLVWQSAVAMVMIAIPRVCPWVALLVNYPPVMAQVTLTEVLQSTAFTCVCMFVCLYVRASSERKTSWAISNKVSRDTPKSFTGPWYSLIPRLKGLVRIRVRMRERHRLYISVQLPIFLVSAVRCHCSTGIPYRPVVWRASKYCIYLLTTVSVILPDN